LLIDISAFYFTLVVVVVVAACTEPSVTHAGKFMFVVVHYKWVLYEF
jgi:hypothetical protein